VRSFPITRPGSFLPIYSILLAIAQLWLTKILHGAGRNWMVYDPAAPARFIPVFLATLLGLGAITLWIMACIASRHGKRPMNRVAFQASAITSLVVLYALLTITGYWLGYL
jgi:hypothetical protein